VLRRVSSIAALIAVAALALAAPAATASTSHDGGFVFVVSGDVLVPRGETVDGILVVSGDVQLAGRSKGDVVLLSGDALVGGTIEGNLITLGGRARLLPSAHVTGDVDYGDERPLVAPTARVVGDVQKTGWSDSFNLAPVLGAFVLWLAIGVSAAILGALLLLIAPRAADAIQERSRERVGPVIAIGIAIAICLPLAAAIAAVTVVGLPLAFAILLALLPLWALAYVVAAWVLGRAIVKPPRHRVLSFLAGLAILRAAALIPALGLLIGLAAAVFGLGLLGAAIGAARENSEPARSPDS
jgi:cytoskeletal protein CcmA (bactofilin family)